jgi:hypothetical protein
LEQSSVLPDCFLGPARPSCLMSLFIARWDTGTEVLIAACRKLLHEGSTELDRQPALARGRAGAAIACDCTLGKIFSRKRRERFEDASVAACRSPSRPRACTWEELLSNGPPTGPGVPFPASVFAPLQKCASRAAPCTVRIGAYDLYSFIVLPFTMTFLLNFTSISS